MINFDSPSNQSILAYMERAYVDRANKTARELQTLIDNPPDLPKGKREDRELLIARTRQRLQEYHLHLEQYPKLKNSPIRRSNELDTWKVGPHPEIVEYLWETLGNSLPLECGCHISGTLNPLLVHPDTGVIFGYAGGILVLL